VRLRAGAVLPVQRREAVMRAGGHRTRRPFKHCAVSLRLNATNASLRPGATVREPRQHVWAAVHGCAAAAAAAAGACCDLAAAHLASFLHGSNAALRARMELPVVRLPDGSPKTSALGLLRCTQACRHVHRRVCQRSSHLNLSVGSALPLKLVRAARRCYAVAKNAAGVLLGAGWRATRSAMLRGYRWATLQHDTHAWSHARSVAAEAVEAAKEMPAAQDPACVRERSFRQYMKEHASIEACRTNTDRAGRIVSQKPLLSDRS